MLTNVDQGLRGRNIVNIRNPVIALLCWGKLNSDC